tara:strand:- start:625 stop:1092 length:468 start_codon:yes stop_codon:yes gene_type:complete
MMTRKAFSFALPMVLLAAACSDNSDTAPDPDATMTVEPDGGIGDGAGPPEPVTADTVPAAFLGVWDAGGGDCAPASLTRMEILPTTFQFYESHGDVTRIEVDSPEKIVVSLAMEGEGEQWQMARMFTLSDNGQTLTPSAVDPEEQFEPTPLTKCE